jgi:hypothetical protein
MSRSPDLPDILIVVCLILLIFSASALSQERERQYMKAGAVARAAGKVTVVVVGTAAKGAWVTTKFAARHGAKPVARIVMKKAIPAAAKIAVDTAGEGVKRGLPIAVKLALL